MPRDRGDVADFALARGDADEAPHFSLTVMEDDERPERPAIRPLHQENQRADDARRSARTLT